jgi:hypothetical protein
LFAVEPVPPAALGAALFMIAVGIVVVVVYGQSRKRAWAPQQTYAFADNPSGNNESSAQFTDTILMAPDEIGGPDGVTGLDETLETKLIPQTSSDPSGRLRDAEV